LSAFIARFCALPLHTNTYTITKDFHTHGQGKRTFAFKGKGPLADLLIDSY